MSQIETVAVSGPGETIVVGGSEGPVHHYSLWQLNGMGSPINPPIIDNAITGRGGNQVNWQFDMPGQPVGNYLVKVFGTGKESSTTFDVPDDP